MDSSASTVQLIGAGGFGALIGWYIYYVIRHRTDQVAIGDIGALVGVIGGGAMLTLFPAKSDLFGAYGIGLFCGFFAYFLILLAFVWRSPKFGIEWFLDGRRKELESGEAGSQDTPMSSV